MSFFGYFMRARKLLWIVLIVTLSQALQAEEDDYRIWTEAKTNRAILGKIKDKKIDNSAFKILTKQGKTVWIKTARLIKKDQAYITNWIAPVDHLQIRVVGSRKGRKIILIKARAGAKPLKVLAYESRALTKHTKRILNVGEEIEFKVDVARDYVVKAFAGDQITKEGDVTHPQLVDQETAGRKTGL